MKQNILKRISIIIGVTFILILLILGAFLFTPKLKSSVLRINKTNTTSSELTSAEIDQISNSVVALRCYKPVNNTAEEIFGSGTIINSKDLNINPPNTPYNSSLLLTNGHVVGSSSGGCYPGSKDRHPVGWWKFITSSNEFREDSKNDFAILYEPRDGDWLCDSSVKRSDDPKNLSNGLCTAPKPDDNNIKNLSSKELNINSCNIPKNSLIGQKIWIFGYPGLAFELDSDNQFVYKQNEITTTGIISGIDSNGNFFTDAKIDNGSSGGLAVAKVNNKPCIVGIPTWVAVGNTTALGLIQPIDNVTSILK